MVKQEQIGADVEEILALFPNAKKDVLVAYWGTGFIRVLIKREDNKPVAGQIWLTMSSPVDDKPIIILLGEVIRNEEDKKEFANYANVMIETLTVGVKVT